MSEAELIALVQDLANEVQDPCGLALGLSIGIVDMGLLRSLNVARMSNGWNVALRLRLTSPGCFYFFYFEREIRNRLKEVQQIKSLNIEWDQTLDWAPEEMSDRAQKKLQDYRSKLLAAKTLTLLTLDGESKGNGLAEPVLVHGTR